MSKYEAALADSRVLNWFTLAEKDPPVDQPYYVSGYGHYGWSIFRVDPTCPRVRPIWAAHWAPDLLGLPYREVT